MKTSKAGVVLVVLLSVRSDAMAQLLEAGGAIGNGQRGSESALIRTEARLVTSAYVGRLWGDRVETVFRAAWLHLPSTRWRATYYYGCEPRPDGRCFPTGSLGVVSRATSARRFTSGQVLYHFRRGRQVRPFAGAGVGAIRDTEERACEVAGCVDVIPGLAPVLGPRTTWYSDILFPVAGIASRLGDRFTIRAGVEFHRPFGEEISLFETFVGAGCRF